MLFFSLSLFLDGIIYNVTYTLFFLILADRVLSFVSAGHCVSSRQHWTVDLGEQDNQSNEKEKKYASSTYFKRDFLCVYVIINIIKCFINIFTSMFA